MNEEEGRDEAPNHHDAVVTGAVPAVETTVSADRDHVFNTQGTDAEQAATSDKDSPTSPQSKVRGWIKNRFSRSKSVSEQESAPEKEKEKEKKRRSLFRSGTSKRGQNGTISSLEPRSSSMRDVALAGRDEEEPHEPGVARESNARDSRGVSPVSSVEDRSRSHYDDEHEDSAMRPPRPIADPAPRSSISPNRGTRFREEIGSGS